MSIDLQTLREQIQKGVFLSREDIDNLFHTFQKKVRTDNLEFMLLKCTHDKIREDDFIDFLLDGITRYALKTKEYAPEGRTPQEREIWWHKNVVRIARRAKHQFANSKHMGELGELFLFMILESKGIVQLLNKMSLKTSAEMPIHGLDGIHIEVDNEKIILHYGYSKMYKQFAKALDDLLDEVSEFIENKSRRRHEIDLVSSNIDEIRFEGQYENLVKLLSPYYSNKEILAETNSLFLGYQWAMLKKSPTSRKNLSEYQIDKYENTFDRIIRQYERKKQKILILNNERCNFYILPFRDLDKIRDVFREEIKGEGT